MGVNYSEQAKTEAGEVLNQLRAVGEAQALDRKIRQMLVDLPALEKQLHLAKGGSAKKLLAAKIARMEAVLDEFANDKWLAGQIQRYPAALAEQIKATRAAVDALKARAAEIESK